MTVFKGYMKIAKNNKGMFFLYVAIFFGVTLMFQSMNRTEEILGYESEKLQVAVLNEDNGACSRALTAYLKQFHQVTEMKEDRSKLQEELFYRKLEYIVRIPENFYERCVLGDEALKVTKIPGSYAASYADQQLNSFLNNARVYAAAGFDEEETAEAVKTAAKAKVELVQVKGSQAEAPAYVFYFRYMPYLFLGVLGYVVGSMVSAMNRTDLKKKMEASAVSRRRQSLEGLLACATVALVLYGVVFAAAALFYGKSLLTSPELLWYGLNALALLCVTVSISFLIGNLARDVDALNGIVNIVSLGFCFLGGAFVPLEIMSQSVKKAGQFLPVYWFEQANDWMGELGIEAARTEVLEAIGIQFVFAAVFVCVTLAVGKARQSA